MHTSPPNGTSNAQTAAKDSDKNAFARLVSLPPGTDKNTLIQTIDGAVSLVLTNLSAHKKGPLPADLLLKVQTSLVFLEQCLSFDDEEFIAFAKKRANELQAGLTDCLMRIEAAKKPKATADAGEEKTADQNKPEIKAEAATVAKVEVEVEADTPASPEAKTEEVEEEAPVSPTGFIYVREEKLLIEYAYKKFAALLTFLRDDQITVVNQEQVMQSGITDDGVAPFFILSPEFPEIIRQPFKDMIKDKRDLLGRRVYIHANKDDDDAAILALYEESHARDINGILALGFDSWAGELSKAGIAGLPQEQKTAKPKAAEKEEGIGSSLKKVFSFGKKSKKAPKAAKVVIAEDTNPIRIHKEWEALERKGTINLSQHFSYSLLSYIMNMSQKQFETECECIRQIVDQQENPDVGPVVTNLSRLYKFYDNIFFDLVIVVLFHRKNKFDINMLQAACMSQNFVVDRLPLTMDELRRRPLDHAKNVVAVLKEGADKKAVKKSIETYMYVHETIHASKVGKRIAASENLLKRQVEKCENPSQKVLKGILQIFDEITALKTQQEEEGTFLGEEILEAITLGIDQAVADL